MSSEKEEKITKLRRKALENFLSGRKNPGSEQNNWAIPREKLTEEDKKVFESLAAPITSKDLKIRGRKKGIKTPRQTFRIDEALWRQFQKACRRKANKSASQVLREFIYRYTHG